jgi:hypothetical protein
MSGFSCKKCSGPATFALELKATAEYPAARIFTCERCGHVMWEKKELVQLQQQLPQSSE